MLTATVYATSLRSRVARTLAACNYNADATDEDGSARLATNAEDGYDCGCDGVAIK